MMQGDGGVYAGFARFKYGIRAHLSTKKQRYFPDGLGGNVFLLRAGSHFLGNNPLPRHFQLRLLFLHLFYTPRLARGQDLLGHLAPRKEHPAEDGPHARPSEGGVGRHACHVNAGADLPGIVDREPLGFLGPHGALAHELARLGEELHVCLALDDVQHLRVVARGVDHGLRVDRERVHVKPRHLYGRPGNDKPHDTVLADHHVLDGNAVEDLRPGLHGAGADRGDRLDGVGRVVAGLVLLRPDPEEVEYLLRLFLDNDLIEHHPAAPHAAADAELALVEGDPLARLRQKVGRDEPRGPAAHNGHIDVEVRQELLRVRLDDGPGDGDFVEWHENDPPSLVQYFLSSKLLYLSAQSLRYLEHLVGHLRGAAPEDADDGRIRDERDVVSMLIFFEFESAPKNRL